MDSTDFVFGGISSQEMGVLSVKLPASDLPRKHFMAPKEAVFDQIPYNDTPYYYTIKQTQLRFTLWLALADGNYWDTTTRSKISRWLHNNNQFTEFYSMDDPEKRYFVIVESAPDLYTNSMGNQSSGYIQINFLSLNNFTYSPAYNQIFDLSNISSPTTITFSNLGDTDLYPDLEILKYGAGDLSIVNLSNGGATFKFTGLNDQEDLTVDNQNRIITTSLTGTYRYDAFNGNYLALPRGINTLQITGACKLSLSFRYQLMG